MLLSILVGLALAHAMFGCFYVAVVASKQEAPVVVDAIQIAGPPDIFCPTAGCFYMADHAGCCGECDVCAQFGSHDAPVVSAWKFDESGTIAEDYVGAHRGAPEATLHQFSGYVGDHRADNHPLYA